MSGTFACPHCGAQYPIKPVLVGRAVRCTTCKQPFRLRPDGVADKVVEEPVAQPAAVTPPAEPSVSPAQPASAPPVGGSPATASTNRPTRTRTDRLDREQMEAQRRTMAASLATAASAALQSEAIKREAQPEKGKSNRIAKPKPNADGRVGEIGPVVLTGHGENEHRNNMLWLFGSIITIGVLVTLVALLSMRSDQRKALDAFTAVIEGERARYGERMLAIQERAWMVGVAPLIDLGRVQIFSVRSLPMTGVSDVLSRLKDTTYVVAHDLWVASAQTAQAEAVWDGRQNRAANLARLQQAKITAVDGVGVRKELIESGWDESDADLLMRLLTSQTSRSGENTIARKLLAGEVPDAIEICPFRGVRGELLIDLGRSYRQRSVDYEGTLLRFVGAGWSNEWKVLDITTSSRD